MTWPSFAAVAAAGGVIAGAACCVALAASPRRLLRGWRLPYGLALAVNIGAVSLGGRFDSQAASSGGGSAKWPTLFAPAGFAFAIWGVIYLGEVCGLIEVLGGARGILRGTRSAARSRPLAKAASAEGTRADKPVEIAPVENAVRASNEAWVGANLAQALWCVSFRPWAIELLWLPTILLGVAAGCLFVSQRRILSASRRGPPTGTVALLWPRSLHLGWLLAATLVNANGWVGHAAAGLTAALAVSACSLAAAAAAVTGLLYEGMPAAACSLAWALFACSRGHPTGIDAEAVGPVAMAGLALAQAGTSAVLAAAIAINIARGWMTRLDGADRTDPTRT
jgi:hypothetical protein